MAFSRRNKNAANSSVHVAEIFGNGPVDRDRTERRYEAFGGIREDPVFSDVSLRGSGEGSGHTKYYRITPVVAGRGSPSEKRFLKP